jgi:hypothetical protein
MVAWVSYGHHGASMFDMNTLVTKAGTVTDFQFINPHGMIYFDAQDENGNVAKWSAETRGGPNVLTKAGWTQDTRKKGDQITFVGHPAKDGSNSMRLAKVVFPDGRELSPDLP